MSPTTEFMVQFATVIVITLGGICLTEDLRSKPRDVQGQPNPSPAGQDNEYSPSPDFAALINAINTQGAANRKEERTEDNGKKALDIITIIVLALTLFFLGRTYYAIRDQVDEMQKVYGPIRDQANAAKDAARATLEAQRAWIGGYDASLVGPSNPDGVTYQKISVGKTFSIKMQYRNAGREPSRYTLISDPIKKNYGAADWKDGTGPYQTDVREIQKNCVDAPAHSEGIVVFPTEQPSSAMTNTFVPPAPPRNGVLLTQEVIDGSAVIVFLYCARYFTSDSQRHTAFGYFYQGGKVSPDHLGIVQVGNDAN